MLKRILVQSLIVVGGAALLTSCETISESECVAGNWSDLGYRDGVDGRSRSRIAEYVKQCGEYGERVNRSVYLNSYETGLTHYCIYDKGFSLGENGSSYNSVCQGEGAAQFRAGYDNGYAKYELRKKYNEFEYDINKLEEHIEDIKAKLALPDNTEYEIERLRRDKKRSISDLADLKWDFRDFRQKYDLD